MGLTYGLTLSGTITGATTVAFTLTQYSISPLFNGNATASGQGKAIISGPTISGTFSGDYSVQLQGFPPGPTITCRSDAHSIVLTRT
jgi:hypothetical protein